ncbi:DUF4229 domain-containing protein [Streptomyces hoynatensis]|uniref:DUF4229 domain-containing protein n=1 Tax=Streptomyces hoynatensis TaxID=1141874 RepID=A0A3A9YTS9_9ACTN|nr:DUF4229 domain-containing protein [Streptomyces hoynatensis]RKN39179.1 DUF4229 domain-containing protein [Streptomyces hoynatensis]
MSGGPSNHATLRYTGLRFGIFAICFLVVAVLAYVGVIPESVGKANPLWIGLLAIVLSAPISYVVLRGQRDAMSEQVAEKVERARERLNAHRGMEDAAVDAAAAPRPGAVAGEGAKPKSA